MRAGHATSDARADASWGQPTPYGVYLVLGLPPTGAFVALALGSRRLWPLFAAAFQLLSTMTMFAAFLSPELDRFMVITAGRVWEYLLYGTLLYGVWAGRATPSGVLRQRLVLTAAE